jgi:hypothetical protein
VKRPKRDLEVKHMAARRQLDNNSERLEKLRLTEYYLDSWSNVLSCLEVDGVGSRWATRKNEDSKAERAKRECESAMIKSTMFHLCFSELLSEIQRDPSPHHYGRDGRNWTVLDGPKLSRPPSVQLVEITRNGTVTATVVRTRPAREVRVRRASLLSLTYCSCYAIFWFSLVTVTLRCG